MGGKIGCGPSYVFMKIAMHAHSHSATQSLSHSANPPLSHSANQHSDSAAMAGIIFYSADQKWRPWSPQNNQISCDYGGGLKTFDLKPPGAVRRCDGAMRARPPPDCKLENH